MYYEVIYEDGTHSLASYDSEEEMLKAVSEHHRRATSGEPAMPAGQSMARSDVTDAGNPFVELPAVRVKKVLAYKEHPASRDAFEELTPALMKDLHAQAGSVGELITALREFDNPTVVSGPHESNFKAQEDKEYGEEKWQ